jgi:hypothetical protein
MLPLASLLRSDRAENSIMQTITIAVSAILIAAGLVTAPGIINNARDNNATNDLANISYGEEFQISKNNKYLDYSALLASLNSSTDSASKDIKITRAGNIKSENVIACTSPASWLASAKSASGTVFYRSSANSKTSSDLNDITYDKDCINPEKLMDGTSGYYIDDQEAGNPTGTTPGDGTTTPGGGTTTPGGGTGTTTPGDGTGTAPGDGTGTTDPSDGGSTGADDPYAKHVYTAAAKAQDNDILSNVGKYCPAKATLTSQESSWATYQIDDSTVGGYYNGTPGDVSPQGWTWFTYKADTSGYYPSYEKDYYQNKGDENPYSTSGPSRIVTNYQGSLPVYDAYTNCFFQKGTANQSKTFPSDIINITGTQVGAYFIFFNNFEENLYSRTDGPALAIEQTAPEAGSIRGWIVNQQICGDGGGYGTQTDWENGNCPAPTNQ